MTADESRRESRVTLNGATDPACEGETIANAGEFAAMWNDSTDEQREALVAAWGDVAGRAMRCLMQDHAGLLEAHRLAFASSLDLGAWADCMRAFAREWDATGQYTSTIYSLMRMEGDADNRHEVEYAITTSDLRRAAAIAQHLAHDRIDHAVIVNVQHWEDRAGNRREIIVVDGRVLADAEAVEQLLTETGWSKR